MIATLAAVAAGGAGLWGGRNLGDFPELPSIAERVQSTFTRVRSVLPSGQGATTSPSQPAGPVVYYRDPDGPFYAAEPTRNDAGKMFLPVYAEEDVSFEDQPRPAQASAAAAGARRVLFYRNPMGLPDTSPAPKKDSMGMDYIPVYEGDDRDSSTVTVSAGKLQRTGVRSEPATRQSIVRPIRVPGAVQLDERRISVVATRSEAFVDKVANVTTGDRVKKGEALMRLYSPDIANASAQYLTDLRAGGPGSSGARQRLENLGVPEEVISTIERTRQPALSFNWLAPRDGVVLERNVVDGMKAAPGDVLFRLADISTVWVLADVPEHDLAAVRVGARATIRVRSIPGRTFEGRVALIYPQVAKETRTTRARIEVPNADGALLADMYAEVEIGSGSGGPVVAVPDSAVIDTGSRQVVLIDKGEGRFEPRDVEVGLQGGGLAEIRRGVEAGERVVVSANFLIDAESNLKAALSAMADGEKSP